MRCKRKIFIRIVATASVLFGLVALGPAPLQGQKLGLKPHTDLQAQDEKTLESEQTPVTAGQVGGAPVDHRDEEVAVQAGSQDGLTVLSAAQRNAGASDQSPDSAKQVLGAASARLQPETNRSWLWLVLILGTVVGGIVGVKRWADQNIPAAPTVTPKRPGW